MAETKQASSDATIAGLEQSVKEMLIDLATIKSKFGPRPGAPAPPDIVSSCRTAAGAGGGPGPAIGSEECAPKINADGSGISIEACCGAVTYHSESCSVDPCSVKRDVQELQSRLGLI